jgi:DNA-binding PadR family transcriptional regulator
MPKKSSAHTLEYILLGLIRDQPDHGYALYERLKKSNELSLIWQTKRSKLYYLLDKLESDGLLTSEVNRQGPYPDRNVYQITPQGIELLENWIHAPVLSTRYVRLAFLSKLFFAMQENRTQAEDLIAKQVSVCQDWLENLQRQNADLSNEDFIATQVFNFRIGQIHAMLDWLNNCRDSIPE